MHPLEPGLSTSETILRTIRADASYTDEEAKLLDLCLMLHAEHGGGNNSTFAARVLSSSGTDTYSAIAAAIGSLKGPLHGGANIKVMEMLEAIKAGVKNWDDDDEIVSFLEKIIRKEAGDGSGKIYGMGHAVYTLVRSPGGDPQTACPGTGGGKRLWGRVPAPGIGGAADPRGVRPLEGERQGAVRECGYVFGPGIPVVGNPIPICSLRCLPWPVCRAGVPTGSRKSSQAAGSSGRHTNLFPSGRSMCRWTKERGNEEESGIAPFHPAKSMV